MMLYWTEMLREIGIEIPELEEYEEAEAPTPEFTDKVIDILVKELIHMAECLDFLSETWRRNINHRPTEKQTPPVGANPNGGEE